MRVSSRCSEYDGGNNEESMLFKGWYLFIGQQQQTPHTQGHAPASLTSDVLKRNAACDRFLGASHEANAREHRGQRTSFSLAPTGFHGSKRTA